MKRRLLCVISMGLAVIYCVCLVRTACGTSNIPQFTKQNQSVQGLSMEYETRIFDDSIVHTIDIQIAPTDWEDLKINALYKEKYDCTVLVDGEAFHHVGVRTKGNVTLIQSIVREWDRYSLVLDFGAFDESQRYYGLDQLSLHNNICDSSFLRDYLCYDMMAYMGVPAPLISFTEVSVNGETVGLYTAVENMNQSYCLRNFGYEYGNLYKPEHMDIAGMLTGEVTDCKIQLRALSGEGGSVDPAAFMGVTDTTVGLQYQGTKLSNYAHIWDNAMFNIGTSDQKRLVEAIRCINEGENLEQVLDTDMLLRFFAVGAFVLNDDCYTSSAGHNYGLYEKDGQVTMLPWDYDHSLGCTGVASGTAEWTDFINLPIREPLIDVEMENRPLINCLLSEEAYMEQYLSYLDQFMKGYVESGRLEETAIRAVNLIAPYVENDPVSGVSLEEFYAAVDSDLEFCRLRTLSVRGQLDGTIPATKAGQSAQPDSLIDCDHFVSPDSGSLTELLIPEGSGLYFEDFINSIVPRLNTIATVCTLPFSDILSLMPWSSSEEGSMVDSLIASGKVQDTEKLKAGINTLIADCVLDMIVYILCGAAIIAGAVFVIQYGKNRQPRARKGGECHV